jgi:hypothetical protein
MIFRLREHLAAGRNTFAYFKHEETPEGAMYAVQLMKAVQDAQNTERSESL